jgi:hypothetical protein
MKVRPPLPAGFNAGKQGNSLKTTRSTRFAICLKNKGCEDLVVRKIFAVLPDERADKVKYLRVVDESGEDYLYPAHYFFVVELLQNVRRTWQHTLPAATS